jgi:Fe-S-cluster containining protein
MVPIDSAASRLCTACGLCCNGVLFHIVKLQPADSLRALTAAGLKIHRKKHEPYFNQPCRQLKGCTCQIYAERPQRCRLFECEQLRQVAAQALTEEAARKHIDQARAQVERIEVLLAAAGEGQSDRPLAERCQPQGPEILAAWQQLEGFLNEHFRRR